MASAYPTSEPIGDSLNLKKHYGLFRGNNKIDTEHLKQIANSCFNFKLNLYRGIELDEALFIVPDAGNFAHLMPSFDVLH